MNNMFDKYSYAKFKSFLNSSCNTTNQFKFKFSYMVNASLDIYRYKLKI